MLVHKLKCNSVPYSLDSMPTPLFCPKTLCSGGGAQPIIEPKCSGRTFEKLRDNRKYAHPDFWPKCSAICVGILLSEYGNCVIVEG